MPKVSTPLQWNSEFGAEELQGWDGIDFCADVLDRKPIQSEMQLLGAQRDLFFWRRISWFAGGFLIRRLFLAVGGGEIDIHEVALGAEEEQSRFFL